ncbi:UNVERIFIED_CONTAM: Mitochondrial import inner membrane translocase subunit TIM50 [Sesamum calycinum]|uniref:Mitochondrial import inner membrane translocase subunit TIM50 n=1 Tax=Sesamum calycinum TaxID=2727403 RepID=A0AAW2RPK3_9LAMI
MAEMAAAEVYAPRTIQVWRTLLNWVAFVFQIFAQILRGTPSFTQVLSYVGLRHGSLLSSGTPQFKSLPVVELHDFSEEPEEAPLPAAIPVAGGGGRVIGDSPPLEKLTVVLDLDETLVCAYEASSLPALLRTQATEAGLKWFELECISSDKAMRPLVDRIDVENRFSLRLYRPSTISTEYREHVKDLSCLAKDYSRIVIVDNNPFSFLLQPLNGIPCVPFSAGQPQDEQLLEVILPLLKHLSLQKDVRPVLYEKFHMPEWFQKHGIPALEWMNIG